jgi:cyclic pyranopterin phosphate synthase
MADTNMLNSHKLMYHPERVNEFLSIGDTRPIYVEVSPTRRCNAKCSFCAYGNIDRKGNLIEEAHFYDSYMKNVLPSMVELGVKSTMFCGEGEPLVSKHTDDMVARTTQASIDTSMTTNGISLCGRRTSLAYLTWVKISLDAGTRDTYRAIKQVDKFDTIVSNLREICSNERQFRAYGFDSMCYCTIGVQLLLLPENYKEVGILAELCKEAGADYLVIKPFSPTDYVSTDYDNLVYSNMLQSVKDQIVGIDYNIIFRSQAFSSLGSISEECHSLPFWMYISSNGDIYPCLSYVGYTDYVIGNIHQNLLVDIWHSSHRLEVYSKITCSREHCRVSCRMSECNKYLGELVSKGITHVEMPAGPQPTHVNFI